MKSWSAPAELASEDRVAGLQLGDEQPDGVG